MCIVFEYQTVISTLGLSMCDIGLAKELVAIWNFSVDEGKTETKKGMYQMTENNLKQFLPKFHRCILLGVVPGSNHHLCLSM